MPKEEFDRLREADERAKAICRQFKCKPEEVVDRVKKLVEETVLLRYIWEQHLLGNNEPLMDIDLRIETGSIAELHILIAKFIDGKFIFEKEIAYF